MSSAAPKTKIRQSLHAKYRKRGHKNENLWVVYSVKTDSDWILQSDRQLIHWISFLETCGDVIDFDLSPSPVVCEIDGKRCDAVIDATATLRDGTTQWHELTSGGMTERSRRIAAAACRTEPPVTHMTIDEVCISHLAITACRWLKPISFAAGIRGFDKHGCRTDLIGLCSLSKSGTVGSICTQLSGYSMSDIAGTIARLAIEGVIALELESMSFGLRTPWRYVGD